MLALYCVRRAGEPPPGPGLPGVEGEEVRLLEEGALGAWVSGGAGGAATPERLRAHDRVVRAALRSATPLPVRYGAAFAGEERVREALRAREAEFLATLARVAGRVEMGVRVRWEREAELARLPLAPAAPEVEAPRSGREYLELRRREAQREAGLRDRAAELLAAVEAAFAPLGLPGARSVLAAPDTAGLVAHLVQTDSLDSYARQLKGARLALPDHELVPSGPWAPYSFV